jgi:hypothetical protein
MRTLAFAANDEHLLLVERRVVGRNAHLELVADRGRRPKDAHEVELLPVLVEGEGRARLPRAAWEVVLFQLQ